MIITRCCYQYEKKMKCSFINNNKIWRLSSIIVLLSLILFSCSKKNSSIPTSYEIQSSRFGSIYYPNTDEKIPAMILLHGSGGLCDNYSEYGRRFAERGYAVLLLDYFAETGKISSGNDERLTLWPIWQQTLLDGLNYLKKMKSIDPARIGIVGFSRGAWLALTTINRLPSIKAIVDFYGAGTQTLEPYINYMPPILIIQGEDDKYSKLSKTQEYIELLRNNGKAAYLQVYKDVGHAFDRFDENTDLTEDAFSTVFRFLQRYLKE